MRFLWFGKKKKASEIIDDVPELQEVFSVEDYVCITDPLSSRSTALASSTISSCIFAVLGNQETKANQAAQEFFQEHGANQLNTTEFNVTDAQGFSARVHDGSQNRTVLIGVPSVISRATTPFHSEIAAMVKASPEIYVVAIDGIAYATFRIARNFL